jgi:hypothetical protein
MWESSNRRRTGNMDRKELATELVGISKDLAAADAVKTASEMSGARKAAAGKMVLLAKRLVGFDVSKEFEASVKATAALAQQFKDAHADLIKEMNEAEKALKDKQDVLKAYYKDWATQSGYKALRTAVLQQAQQCMSIGDTLDNLADDMKIQRRDSEQEVWKEKYGILVSTLNPAETAKYGRILNTFFRKQFTELKTGLKLLDDDVAQWQAGAQAIADERGYKMPKASVKTANLFEDIADAIKAEIPKLVKSVKDFFSDMLSRVLRNGEMLNDMDRELGSMVAKARSVL